MFNQLLHSILFNLILLKVIIRSNQFQEFNCDQDQNELGLNKKIEIKQIIQHSNGTVYLYVNNKVISFEIPIVFRRDLDDRLLFLNGPFQIETVKAPLINDEITPSSGDESLGYIVDNASKLTYEIYRNQTDKSRLIELEFKEKPAKRLKWETEHYIDPRVYEAEFTYYFNTALSKNLKFLFLRPSLYLLFKSGVLFQEMIKSDASDMVISQYNISKFVYYEYENDKSLLNNKSVFEIDSLDSFHFHVYQISYIQNKSEGSWLHFKRDLHQEIDFEQFFLCYKRFNSPEQVKGIFYHKKTFFIFINHYYIKVNDNLFDTQFKMLDGYFKAQNFIKFNTRVRYENYESKYIKTLKNNVKLVLFDQVFDMKFNKNNDITVNLIEQQEELIECLKNVLSITNYLFCFEEENYYAISDFSNRNTYLKRIKHPIADLFYGLNLNFKKDEQVLFIFNYEYKSRDAIIMMTLNHLYILDYKQARVDLNKLKIVIDPQVFKIEKIVHYFFQGAGPIKTTAKYKTTPKDRTKALTTTSIKDEKESNAMNILIFLLIIALLSIFTLIMLTTFRRKKNMKKKFDKKGKEIKDKKRRKNLKKTTKKSKSPKLDKKLNFNKSLDKVNTYKVIKLESDVKKESSVREISLKASDSRSSAVLKSSPFQTSENSSFKKIAIAEDK